MTFYRLHTRMSQASHRPEELQEKKCTKARALKGVFGLTNEIVVIGDGLCWIYSVLTLMGLMTCDKRLTSSYIENSYTYPSKVSILVEWVKTVCNDFRKKHKVALVEYNKDLYSRWSQIKIRFAEGARAWGNSGSLCVLAGVFNITIVVWSDDGVQITPTPYKCKCEPRCPTKPCQQRGAKFARGYDKDGDRAVQVHTFRDGKFCSMYMDPLLMLERPKMYERMVHLSHQNGNHFDALFNKWWATIEPPTEFQAQYREFCRGQQQAPQAPQARRIPCVFKPLADARQQLQVLQAKHEHLQVAQVEQQKLTLMAVQLVQGKQSETIAELKEEVAALHQKKRKRKRGKGNKKRGKRSSAQKRISAKKNKSSNEPNKLKGVIVHEQEAIHKRRLPLLGPWSRANEVVHGVPPSMIGHSWQRQHDDLHTLKKMFKKT